jgi:hypothetical protein
MRSRFWASCASTSRSPTRRRSACAVSWDRPRLPGLCAPGGWTNRRAPRYAAVLVGGLVSWPAALAHCSLRPLLFFIGGKILCVGGARVRTSPNFLASMSPRSSRAGAWWSSVLASIHRHPQRTFIHAYQYSAGPNLLNRPTIYFALLRLVVREYCEDDNQEPDRQCRKVAIAASPPLPAR